MYIHKPACRGTVRAEPAPDWSQLCRSDHIEVHMPGRAAVSGIIDMIAADRSVFWMIRDDGAGRTMYWGGDDLIVIKIPSESAAGQRNFSAA